MAEARNKASWGAGFGSESAKRDSLIARTGNKVVAESAPENATGRAPKCRSELKAGKNVRGDLKASPESVSPPYSRKKRIRLAERYKLSISLWNTGSWQQVLKMEEDRVVLELISTLIGKNETSVAQVEMILDSANRRRMTTVRDK
jgi:hypothetical protein